MKQKRTLYSLLLTSFILVFAISSASAQDVTFGSVSVLRCQPGSIDITVNNPGDISAFEIIFTVTPAGGADFDAFNVVWDPALTELTTRVIDVSNYPKVRIAGMMIDAGDACLAGGPHVVATVDFNTINSCGGTVEFAGSSITTPVEASTQFVDCGATTLIDADVTTGVVTFINSPPTIDPIANFTLPWGNYYSEQAVGHDADEETCESLTYSLINPPAGMSITPTGLITWTPLGAQVCTHTIEVQVEDYCGATISTTYEICVTNAPPYFVDCPEEVTNIVWGQTATGSVEASDVHVGEPVGPSPIMYSVVSFSGPGTVTVNPVTGDWEWETMELNPYVGEFELCIEASDGAQLCPPCSPENADTCCVTILVIPTIQAGIAYIDDGYQGQNWDVPIELRWPDQRGTFEPTLANKMGGYDFLIRYDASILTFTSATPGQLLVDCDWEYFTYRFGANGNCGPSACPSGIVRIVAIAETNNGDDHPLCFVGDPELAVLHFMVSNDLTFECMFVPIYFYWYDCGDNTVSSVSGDTLWVSRHVYNWGNPVPIEMEADFPTMYGANSSCDVALEDGKPDPLRFLDLFNGGIKIPCSEEIDARGDINLNELAYEIADAVLFSNYFVYGLGVFDVMLEGQIAASDVNADGIALSVADLVYLIRVVVGDALPYPKEVVTVNANYSHAHSGLMTVNNARIGAANVIVEGNATPELLVDNMEMIYNYDGVNTRILVYSLEGNSFTGEFLNVNGNVVSIEMATAEGNPVAAKVIPTEFALKQNYPNPFNPATTMAFELPKAADYDLRIYNINGQEVAAFAGHADAGTVNISWDASNHASGIYFYKLVADNFSNTKKMVLLK